MAAEDILGDPTTARVLSSFKAPAAADLDTDPEFHKELDALLHVLPAPVLQALNQGGAGRRKVDLIEIYMQMGRKPEAIFLEADGRKKRVFLVDQVCQQPDVNLWSQNWRGGSLKRMGIESTLHRISVITHPARNDTVIGVTARVGRIVSGIVDRMAPDLLKIAAGSLLLIGKPGVGKTTVLREFARVLSENQSLNVVVVDKTNEIAGDGETPHRAIGSARASTHTAQHEIMREAVENQSPDVIIVDEISTPQEVHAARTISQRGVRLIATVHGATLPELVNCVDRSALLGGTHTVTIADSAAQQRPDKRKSVQKRRQEPVFTSVLEVHAREQWILHSDVRSTVDCFLNGEPTDAVMLTPGLARSVAAVPTDDAFVYCLDCGKGPTCPAHALGAAPTAKVPSGPAAAAYTHPAPYYSPSAAAATPAAPAAAKASGHGTFGPGAVLPNSKGVAGHTMGGHAMGGHAGGQHSGWGGGSGRRRFVRAPNQRGGNCYNCGERGHFARDCHHR